MAKKKQLTLTEFARMGAEAQLKKYGRGKRSEWGRLGGYPKGRPRKKGKKLKE